MQNGILMTNKEAIKEIQSWTPVLLSSGNYTDKTAKAQTKAISSLSEKNKALVIACDLMLGAFIYSIDSDKLFQIVMDKYGFVCADNMAEWIEENIDRFSDDEEICNKAIERLGF